MRTAAWFLIVFGIVYVLCGAWMFRYYRDMAFTWPGVEAVSEGSRVLSAKGRQRTVYTTEYELRYRAGGRDYITPQFRRGWTANRSSAEGLAQRYAAQTRHPIWYDPGNPHAIRDDVGSLRLYLLPALFAGLGVLTLAIGGWLYRLPVRHRLCRGCGRASRTAHCPYCGRKQPGSWPQPGKRRGGWIGGTVFSVLGLAMLTGSFWWMDRELAVLTQWTSAEATVVSRDFQRRGISSKPTFESRIQFEYQAADNTLRNFSEPMRSSNYAWLRQFFDRFEPGSRQRIRYHPADPSRVRADVGFDLARMAPFAVLGVLGLAFSCIGLWILRALRFVPCANCGSRLRPRYRFCPACGKVA